MDVIRNTPYRFGYDLQSAERAIQVSMKTRAPIRCDKRALVLGAENDVAMET
jgi:hypothetical protein